MRRVGLMGWPIAHSLSPAMHNAAFAALDMNWRYELLETQPEELLAAITRMRHKNWEGANVTIPHKTRVMELLDEIDPLALQVGAVNTLQQANGRLIGYNTDVNGFYTDLRSHGVEIDGRKVVILGSGGAARAVSAGLLKHAARLQFITQEQNEAERLVRDLTIPSEADPVILPWVDESFSRGRLDCNLLINATPVGAPPEMDHCPWPDEVSLPEGAFVYDLVYNPAETRLMRRARESGLDSCGGLGMLIEQGALAFELWTGKTAPREVMAATARLALESRHA